MKYYITLYNLLFVLDKLDRLQFDLAQKFIAYYNEEPKWIDFANYWMNEVIKVYHDGSKITYTPELPIFKIGQDLETRLGIEQGYVYKSFEGPEEFLYDFDRAMNHFQGIIEADPNNPTIYRAIGNLLINKLEPDYEGAISRFEKAIELSHTYRNAYRDLVSAYLQVNRKNDAYGIVSYLENRDKKFAAELKEKIDNP
jgi:tetratricopeptide (TPR) repeat protein